MVLFVNADAVQDDVVDFRSFDDVSSHCDQPVGETVDLRFQIWTPTGGDEGRVGVFVRRVLA